MTALGLYFPGVGTKWPCLTFYFQEAKNEMAPLAVPLHRLGDPTKNYPCGGGCAGSACGLRAELYLTSVLVWFGLVALFPFCQGPEIEFDRYRYTCRYHMPVKLTKATGSAGSAEGDMDMLALF